MCVCARARVHTCIYTYGWFVISLIYDSEVLHKVQVALSDALHHKQPQHNVDYDTSQRSQEQVNFPILSHNALPMGVEPNGGGGACDKIRARALGCSRD